jgi:hypothetical protein
MMSARERLAAALLKDRGRRKDKPAASRSAPRVQQEAFHPFAITRWRIIAGGDPGYLVKTPMRQGPVGWFIACQCCAREFESKGWAYCPTCMELPAEERRANRKPQDCRDCAEARLVPAAPAQNSRASPRETGTENIEEFPPIFGPADWPAILVGSGRRGRALPPDLVESIVRTEASGFLLSDTRRHMPAKTGAKP